jgi:carboxypeptidase A4
MKFQIAPLLLVLSSTTGILAKVNYDGAKAMRIAVGEDVEPLMNLIQTLSLPVWKGLAQGVPKPNSHVDLVVPADKVDVFARLTAKMNTEVMHDDLGASIADEGNMDVYAGKNQMTSKTAPRRTNMCVINSR